MTEALPLVLLPGLLCDEALWTSQTEALTGDRPCQVADLTQDESIAAMAERVLDEAPPGPFALAGLSMGGYVALDVALRAPDRVARLALLDTNAHADSPEQTERRSALIEWAGAGRFPDVMPAMLPGLIHPDRRSDIALVATIIRMADRVGADGFVRQQKAIMSRADRRGELASIQCPTLVLCGANDALTPPQIHQEIQAALPAALPLAIVPDSGHLSALEQPETVTDHLRTWLTA